VNEVAVAIPKSRPLGTGCHLVIAEYATHISDRVLKNGRNGELIEVRAVERELNRTEYCVGIRRYFALEECFNRKRDERCWGDRRCVGG
jgi:hypothetical protein